MLVNPLDPINAGLQLLPPNMTSPAAKALLIAIGLQESGFLVRTQHNNGPARGFWQFEKGGGVRGVMKHKASERLAMQVCLKRGVPFVDKVIWEELAQDDVLAAAFARLLLWTAPKPLPSLGQTMESWSYYNDLWRPGKPHPERWDGNYGRALDLLEEGVKA